MTEHFFNYLEPESIDKLDLKFNNPEKTYKGTYFAKLLKPLKFYLPKSEILGVFEDKFKVVSIKYLIDDEENYEFLNFLDNWDSSCVNLASKNSENWFQGHKFSEDKLGNIAKILTEHNLLKRLH